MAEVTVVVHLRAKPGRGAEGERVFHEVSPATHAEEGCVLYALHRAVGDPDHLVLVERWASREALEEHLAQPHMDLIGEAAALWVKPPEVTLLEPVPLGDPAKGGLAPAG